MYLKAIWKENNFSSIWSNLKVLSSKNEMDLTHIFCLIFIPLGILIMIRHKFYKYDPSDMLFATKLNVFLGGLLFCLIGIYVLVDGIIKLFKWKLE